MPRPPDNTARIADVRDELRRVADMLQQVLDGNMNLTEAAKAAGMSPQAMNKNLRKNFMPYIRSKVMPLTELYEMLDRVRTPSDRFLLMALSGRPGHGVKPDTFIRFPDYDELRFWDVMYERLTKREYEIIACLCGEATGTPMPLGDVAREFRVTRERIRQVQAAACRKLLHPVTMARIFPSISPQTSRHVEKLRETVDEMLVEYGRAVSQYQAKDLLQAAAESYDAEKYPGQDVMDELMRVYSPAQLRRKINAVRKDPVIPLQDADLSPRTYNALHRSGIDTLNQVAEMDLTAIQSLRGLGVKAIDEIGHRIQEMLHIMRPELFLCSDCPDGKENPE